MFVHLHVRSWFSFLAGASSPHALVERAARLGQPALALTDRHGVYGIVRFQKACRELGLHAVTGAEVLVDGAPLVLLAQDGGGYRNLCRLLTEAHLASAGVGAAGGAGTDLPAGAPNHTGPSPRAAGANRDGGQAAIGAGLAHGAPDAADLSDLLAAAAEPLPTDRRDPPGVTLDALAARASGLICLTGGRQGRLWQLAARRRTAAARAWLGALRDIFGDALYVELVHGLLPEDGAVAARLEGLARQEGVPTVAANDARYATPADWRRCDLLTCVRLNLPVAEPHAERPRNAEAYLKSEAQLRRLLPWPEAFARTVEVAQRCRVDLVPEYITPPAARIPEGVTADALLESLCRAGLDRLYPPAGRAAAEAQLRREFGVISSLDLSEFFLVVHEVVGAARGRGIRCAGRGSAANSIVAYLLGITAVDPIRHNLLFERFLHGGRKGTPDIDVDFDADRRDEVIAWMEQRFGLEQTAMTANVVTYKLRLALRDVAKALGWPLAKVDELSQSVPSGLACQVVEHRQPITRVLGASPLLELLFERVADLHGCPRHLGLHVGGMILSRKPLSHFTPVQVSANGVRMVQFDKEDVEAMGLVKLDVLGLRMLACLSEGATLVLRHEGIQIDFHALPLDDEGVFELIRSGKTVTLFQIESQGQMHLIAKNQPETFDDLVAEVALFRPGPLQGGMVHPFVRRRRGLEPVVYEHPSLEPILRDTYGVILFQEQVLDVAHRFAGLSLAEADDFRCLMSKRHDPERMREMGVRFVAGAVARGVPQPVAQSVFEQVSHFIGYGFCRSHAAAFALTVYHSAWMKCYHPAAHLAAFMQHRPGFYNLMTIEEEARRFGVPVLLPEINQSGTRYDLARLADGRLAIRKPLTAIKGLSEEVARQIVWARMSATFRSVEDLATRVFLDRRVFDGLACSGALDALAGSSRTALWEAGVAANRLETRPDAPRAATLFEMPLVLPEDVPELPPLTAAERLSWDYRTTGAGRVHPLTLARRHLNDLGVLAIDACFRMIPMFPKEGAHAAGFAGGYDDGLPSGAAAGRVAEPNLGASTEAGAGAPAPDTAARAGAGPAAGAVDAQIGGGQRGKGLLGGGAGADQGGPLVTVAGIAILRQRPPTAKGYMFVTLEDETGFLQCIVRPTIYAKHYDALIQPAVIFRGQLQATGHWRGVVVHEAWPLAGVFGGYSGFPSSRGGQDHLDDGGRAVASGRALEAPPPPPIPDAPDAVRKAG